MNKDNTQNDQDMKSISYELFIMMLSLLSLFNLIVIVAPVQNTLNGVVYIMDGVITIIFMMDFLFRFLTTASKRNYMLHNWGWADLLASMPAGQFKIFRIFRMLRVIRILRVFGLRRIVNELLHKRAGSALYITLLAVIFVLEFGALAVVQVESAAADANIQSAGDGVWWAFVTITTVGYGDRYPITKTGRLIGMLVMTLGVGTFGVLTAFLANAFVPTGEEETEEKEEEESGSGGDLAEFRRLLDEQERINAALRSRLAKLEANAQS